MCPYAFWWTRRCPSQMDVYGERAYLGRQRFEFGSVYNTQPYLRLTFLASRQSSLAANKVAQGELKTAKFGVLIATDGECDVECVSRQ
jgi:hypothetical protein